MLHARQLEAALNPHGAADTFSAQDGENTTSRQTIISEEQQKVRAKEVRLDGGHEKAEERAYRGYQTATSDALAAPSRRHRDQEASWLENTHSKGQSEANPHGDRKSQN